MPGGPLGIPVRQVLQVGANFNGVQEVPDVCFVWVGSRGPITMLVYRLWYRRELPFTIQDAVAATIYRVHVYSLCATKQVGLSHARCGIQGAGGNKERSRRPVPNNTKWNERGVRRVAVVTYITCKGECVALPSSQTSHHSHGTASTRPSLT